MSNCETCKVSVYEKPLFRNGPIGIQSNWRCYEHLDLEYRVKISLDTLHLVEAIADT